MTARRLEQHRDATTLAMLFVAERQRPAWTRPEDAGFEYDLAAVIERFFDDWPDVKKADLYAILAENIKPNDTIAMITRRCSDALWCNEEHFRG